MAAMLPSLVPVKTPQGQAELAQRTLRLSQRHRTLLLLVDGKRSVTQVLEMAAAAGVPSECFEELIALGLVAGATPAEAADTMAELDPVPAAEDSQLPPLQSLLPESQHGELTDAVVEPDDLAAIDRPMEEARELLMRAVRNEAPVTGTLTLMKLKRAAHRDELSELLEEVEQRIRKPRKQLINAQLMRQVRHLLTLPPDT